MLARRTRARRSEVLEKSTTHREDLGFTPTDAELAEFVGQGGSSFEKTAPKRVENYVDPRQVTDSEARKFFKDLGYNPTDKQVAQFVAQVEETTQQDVISKYVDPRQVTQADVSRTERGQELPNKAARRCTCGI